ncbi:3-isopropylmalate dehydratase large subunit [PVC group bacterium]|nr:3-isopropylmalate dehydratase large subunit [PVC group bacterium]
MALKKNIYEKIWDMHLVYEEPGRDAIIYIDTHFVHEVTSPQAFESLRLSKRSVRRPQKTFATMDHNVPTSDRSAPIKDVLSKKQIETLRNNCHEFDVTLFDMDTIQSGIVHIIGPELGITHPGATIVCGDSHTSTHGAFGALAFGIGTSEVEHVLATQTLTQKKSKTFEIRINGKRPSGVTAKDVILAVIGKIGTAGATGYVVEYTGEVIRDFNLEERMTVCNMSIEAGARAGLISPDDKTCDYLKERKYIPQDETWEKLTSKWKNFASDEGAVYDKTMELFVDQLEPQITWGTTPEQVTSINGSTPDLSRIKDPNKRKAVKKALQYMGLNENMPLKGLKVDRVFIGSCTNSRMSDLREASKVVKGYKTHSTVNAMVVPGSQSVKKMAEEEGLDKIFKEAGFDWRESGCSMCLGMNPDQLRAEERCASTSNRNFEGRQGKGGRTHLVSPVMAAAAAIKGSFVDIREWKYK